MTYTQNQCRVPNPRLPLELISCIACNYWCITESSVTLPAQDILYLYIHCIHTQIHGADAGNNTTQPRRPCPSPSPEQQTLRPGARASTLRRPAHARLPVDGTGPGALPKEHRVSPVWAHAYTSRCTNSKVTSARAQGNDGGISAGWCTGTYRGSVSPWPRRPSRPKPQVQSAPSSATAAECTFNKI